MARRWDVLGVGAVAVDDLVYVDGSPQAGTKVPIQEERREGGGLVATALVAVARLGGTAGFVGILGDDELSRFTVAELEREGVDCSRVQRRAGARPIHSVIVVDRRTGQRTLMYNMDGVTPLAIADLSPTDMSACRVLLVDSTMPSVAAHAVELAHRAGVPVVADLEHPRDPDVVRLAREVDHLVVGLDFGAGITGRASPREIAEALWSPALTACVVTAGEQGCWYIARETGGAVVHHPGLAVEAVDTNGCGDVFHGAYAGTLARGSTVATAIAVATVAAAVKATVPGGRRGIPDRPEVERILGGRVGRPSTRSSPSGRRVR
jgi:sulfofructose kinase